jgi:hypothetical protein
MDTSTSAVAVAEPIKDLAIPDAPTTDLGISAADMVAASADEKTLAQYGSARGWLPRLELCGASSNLCKEGKQPVGTYALVLDKDTHQDMGKEVNAFICGLRLCALDFRDGVTSFYDPKSVEFQQIAELSEVKDSNCMAGMQFLLYIPKLERFCTFYMASISQSNESPNVKALLGKAATLLCNLAENKKKQKWHVTQAIPCTLALTPPPADELALQLHKFKNPPKKEVVLAEGEDRAR